MYTRRKFTKEEEQFSDKIRTALVSAEELLDKLPNSDEKTIALTHIEDAMLHSNLAITKKGLMVDSVLKEKSEDNISLGGN